MFPNNFPDQKKKKTLCRSRIYNFLRDAPFTSKLGMWNFVHLVYCYFLEKIIEGYWWSDMVLHSTLCIVYLYARISLYRLVSSVFFFYFILYNTWLLKRCMSFKFGISSQQMLFNNWNKKSKVFVCVFLCGRYKSIGIGYMGSCIEVMFGSDKNSKLKLSKW